MARCCVKYLNLRDFGMPAYANTYPDSIWELPFQNFWVMGLDESLPSEAPSPDAQQHLSPKIQNGGSFPKQTDQCDFYEYASRYWMDHLVASSAREGENLGELATALSEAHST
jgi:hypothetical protein